MRAAFRLSPSHPGAFRNLAFHTNQMQLQPKCFKCVLIHAEVLESNRRKNSDFIIPSVDGFGLAERARLLTGFREGHKGSQDFWVGG